jgi:hypothetical protein
MKVFKPFTTSDVIVTPFQVNKTFTFEGTGSLEGLSVGIDRYIGRYIDDPVLFDPNNPNEEVTGHLTSSRPIYKRLVYESIKQLYYSNFTSSRYTESGSYENYLGTTINHSLEEAWGQSPNLGINRYFPFTNSYDDSVIGVITIPQKMYGERIVPGTFSWITPTASLADDGAGNIYDGNRPYRYLGNVLYDHGIVTITKNDIISAFNTAEYGTAVYGRRDVYGSATGVGDYVVPMIIEGSDFTCSFQSTYTIQQTQYKCTITPNEYTATLNPSIFYGTGSVYDFATSSYFSPYITTIGLYNDNQELLAVAKLAQPVQSPTVTDLTFVINLDR